MKEMKNWKEFVRKNWVGMLLGLIILGAVFLRVYKFEDWLYFQADQVRDAKLSAAAFEDGIENLPLLGPRAAGTTLRLGPVFYYMQYVSTKIFNSIEPHVLAYPDLLFSILTIPLLFFFLRNFLSIRNSFLITAIYSFSFLLIQYGRFAWNPNSITFWGLLLMFSLFKSSQEEKPHKAGFWFLLLAFTYGIVSQLHFVAFVGFPVVTILYWFFYFPKRVNWKYWLGGILIFLTLYIPVIVSDVYNEGNNFKHFIYATTAKTGGENNELGKNLKQICISFSMFTTSFGHKDSFFSMLFGGALILAGLFSGFYLAKKDEKLRPILYLFFVWFGVFMLVLIKTDTSMKPRFFFPIAAIPFIIIGLAYSVLDLFDKKYLKFLIYGSFGFFLLANLQGIKIYYDFFNAEDKDVIYRQIFIKQHDAKFFERHFRATEYMANVVRENGKIACFYSGATYERTYEYIFKVYFPDVRYDRISKIFEDKEECQYFSIITTGDDKKIGNSYNGYFTFDESHAFGRVEVWKITAKDNFLNYDKDEDPTRNENQTKDKIEKSDEEIKDELGLSLLEAFNELKETTDVENKPPERIERVLWKDVLEKEKIQE